MVASVFVARRFRCLCEGKPKFKNAKPLSFEEWPSVEADATPETYVKESGPVENPYAADLKARGITPEGEGEGE